MKLKTLVIAVVVLAVLSLIAFWAGRPAAPAAADTRVGQVLVDPSAIEKAASLRLSDSGKTVVLERQSDGTWKDASYFGLPVDFSKLSSFMSDLASAKLQRLVTTQSETLARLDFKDSKIDLVDASGHSLWSVTLGKNADGGGRFVRFGNEPRAYLANLNAWMDSDPKNWADAQLINLKADDIAKVKVGFDSESPAPAARNNAVLEKLDELKKFGSEAVHESVTVSRSKKDDPWSADKPRARQRISADKVSTILSSFASLRFSDTTDLSDPQAAVARAHSRTFELTTFDGKTTTIVIGRKPEEKKLKPPPPAPKSAPAAAEDKSKSAGAKAPAAPAKAPEPEYDTIPAGPVYVWITSSDARAPVNALMKKREFQVDEYTYTSLPQKSDELFEAAPTPAPAKAAPTASKK